MEQTHDPKLNPSTGRSGSHPVGTGVDAAGAAVAGQSADENVNPTVEDAYWSANNIQRDYVERSRPYADYRPAYQYGWESRARLGNRLFLDVEGDLERGWDLAKGESKLAWAQAKNATSDAWHRLGCAGHVDTDRGCH